MPENVPPRPSTLPPEIAATLALLNENVLRTQPAVMANLALAGEVLAKQLQQQAAVAHQQALNLVTLAVAARCAHAILDAPAGTPVDRAALREFASLLREIQPASAPSSSPLQPA